jgi:hypothetical protein
MFMLSFIEPAMVLSMFMLSFIEPAMVLSMFMLSFIFVIVCGVLSESESVLVFYRWLISVLSLEGIQLTDLT